MSRRLYLTALRLSMTGSIGWTVGIILYVLLVVYIYPSMRDAFPYQQYLEALPEQFRAAIGAADESALALFLSGDGVDFRAWLNTEYLTWLPFLLGIYAVVYCGGLVSREVDRGTLDLVLSQPVQRYKFLLTKFVAFASIVVGITVVSYVALVATSQSLSVDISYRYLLIPHVVGVLFVLAIAAYATLASCMWLEPGKSLAIPGVATALIYFLHILGPSIKAATWLQKGSLFYYYDSLSMVFLGRVSWAGIGVYMGVMLGCLLLAVVIFQRKDIVR